MSDSSESETICSICKIGFDYFVRGIAHGINNASIRTGVVVVAGCKVDSNCRKKDINLKNIVNQQKINDSSKPILKTSARASIELSIAKRVAFSVKHKFASMVQILIM